MSLMQRSAYVSKPTMFIPSDGLDQALEILRSRVSEIIPSAQAARLIAVNPHQARSELRLACEQVIKEEPWLVKQSFTTESLVERYLDDVFGLGPLEDMLADESITEIMVNGSSSLFYERDGKLQKANQSFGDDGQVYALIDRIIGPLGRRIDESSPMVNARLPQGHRLNAIIPPWRLMVQL